MYKRPFFDGIVAAKSNNTLYVVLLQVNILATIPSSVETELGHPVHPGQTCFKNYLGLTRIGSCAKQMN